MSGPAEFENPDLNDANPPKPPEQGNAGMVHYQAPMTSSRPRARMSMAATLPIDQPLRGYKTKEVGGSFMPDNGVQGAGDMGSTESYS